MKHLITEGCDCEFCQMIDCMYGDPLLSDWEKEFVNSVCEYGWKFNYTVKQKNIIRKIFNQQQRKYRGTK